MTSTNSSYVMTEEQKYLFDLNGYLVVPGVLSAETCRIWREYVITLKNDPDSLPDHERYSAIDEDPETLHLVTGPTSERMDNPTLVGILNEILIGGFIGAGYPDAYPWRMESCWATIKAAGEWGVPPHAPLGLGPLFDYQCRNQEIYSGMLRVVWELNPVGADDEGTTFANGSHKANFKTPEHLLENGSPIMQSYSCPEGSIVIFTEAVTHAGGLWKNPETPRIAILDSYCPIYAQYHRTNFPPEVIEKLPRKRQTLFRGVWGSQRGGTLPGKPAENNYYSRDNRQI